MNESQFVEWLKGFTEGVHTYSIGPKQWEHLKERLSRVKAERNYNYQSAGPGWVTTTTWE